MHVSWMKRSASVASAFQIPAKWPPRASFTPRRSMSMPAA
jgi:hypothetical protein